MNTDEIHLVKKSFDKLGIDRVEKILIDWVYGLNIKSFDIESDDMAVIAGYSKYTVITEANMTSIRQYIDYILFEIVKYNKKYKRKEKETIIPIETFTEKYNIEKPV